MMKKQSLKFLAKVFRVVAALLDNWPWVALVACILSPISPHVSLGLVTGYSCDYLGTRGVIAKVDDQPCAPVVILNTQTGEVISW